MKLATPNQLNAQAELFEAAAKKLREIASMLDAEDVAEKVKQPVRVIANNLGKNNQPTTTVPSGGRFQQIREYLKTHGPSTRTAVRVGTDLPLGTLATVLSHKKGFRKNETGGWFYPPDIKETNSAV